MIDIFTMEQGSDEWYGERKGSLGSSSVKNAMAGGQGKSRKTLAYNLIAEKITGEKTSFKGTPAMDEGTRREAESRNWYSLYSGIEWEEVGLIRNTDYPGQHTSPDGVNLDLKIGLELKNVQGNTMVRYLDKNTMVSNYVAQCQHAMMITGWEQWHFVAYHPAFDKQLIIILKRDEVYISKMEKSVDLFLDEMESIIDKIQGE